MKLRVTSVLLALALCAFPAIEVNADQSVVPSLSKIKDALVRYFCFQDYWQGIELRQGVPLPLRVVQQQQNFTAWIEDVEITPKARMSWFLDGRSKKDSFMIVSSFGVNASLSPPHPKYENLRREFEGSLVQVSTIVIPSDCTPHYEAMSPEKEQMLTSLVTTLQRQLSREVDQGIASYPKDIKLVIADFNTDYSHTFVRVEPSEGFFYKVALHDPNNFENEAYIRGEEYILQDIRIQPQWENVLKRIKKHAIIRPIALTLKRN